MDSLQPTPTPATDGDDSDDSSARARKRRAVIRRGWSDSVASASDAMIRELRFDLGSDCGTVTCEVDDGADACVSDSAICLARYLERNRAAVAGKSILELGCGSGFLGLVAAALGARSVDLTDLDNALPLAERNCERFRNARGPAAEVRAAALPWGLSPTSDYDVVLVADCLLRDAAHLYAPLCDTLADCLRSDNKGYFACEQRTSDLQPFFDRLHELEITALLITDLHPSYSAPEIFVYELELDTSGNKTRQQRASTESSNSS